MQIYKLQIFYYYTGLQQFNKRVSQMDETNKDQGIKKINEKLNLLLQKKGINLETTLQKPAEKKAEQPKPQNENNQSQEEQKNVIKTKKIKKQQKHDKNDKKQAHNLRKVAGIVWEDKTMEEWPENDYRVFVGNLGNQTTDEVLSNVFRARYPSFNMARVVRDRRTGKSRGYGFASFAQPRDFLNVLKQMNGQYIGNRPAKIVKSNWKDRDINSAQNQLLPSDFRTNSKKETNKIFTNYKYVHPY